MSIENELQNSTALTEAVKVAVAEQSLAANKAAQRIKDEAMAIGIDSPEMLVIATDTLRGIATIKSQLEERRMNFTRPLDAAKRLIMDLFAAPGAALADADAHLRKEVRRWNDEQERIRVAELNRQREEQETARKAREAERLAAEQKLALAADPTEIAVAEAALEAVAEAEATEEVYAPAVTTAAKPAGVSERATWAVEAINLQALVLAAANDFERWGVYLLADEKALNGLARSLKDKAVVPGVAFAPKKGLSVRGFQ
jgi:hypothetical protein